MKLDLVKINKELERLNWTKYTLAEKMGCNKQWVYILLGPEYGGVTLKTVEKIAAAIGIEPKDILT